MAIETEQSVHDPVRSFQDLKTFYFQNFSMRHLKAFKALGYIGEILGKEHKDWRNSAEHTVVAGAYAELLAEKLGLPENELASVGSAAVLHEIDKREEVRILKDVVNPIEALREIEIRADLFHKQLLARGIPEDIIRLSKANVPTSPTGPKTLPEKIIWYVDIMLSDTQPELVLRRIIKFEEGWNNQTQTFDPDRRKRNQRLNEAYRPRFAGRSLTEVQRNITASIEKEFAERLGFNGDSVLLPFHLKQLLYERITQWGVAQKLLPEKTELPVTPEVGFGLKLVNHMREAILPVFGIRQHDVPIGSVSHDFQYAVDEKAEEVIKRTFEELWKKGVWYGYSTEEQGLVLPPGHTAELVYLIDPVDGSRPAQAGMETACITMAIVNGNKSNPTFRDITAGVTHAIKENRTFITQKGGGVYEVNDGTITMCTPHEHAPDRLSNVFMAYENYGVSEKLLGTIIDELRREVQSASVYVAGSFGVLSLVRGQNELYVDVREQLLKEYPHLPVALKPHTKCLQPYDIAAPWLMLNEIGGVATTTDGTPLNDLPLLVFEPDGSWSSKGNISLVAATTPQLHAQAMACIQLGFSRLQ